MVTQTEKESAGGDLWSLIQQATRSAPKPKATAATRTPVTERESRSHCEVDGQSYVTHLSCVECTILVGPGHLEQGVDDQGRCGNCALPVEERILSWVVPVLEEALAEEAPEAA